jgi:hypothetical protein
MHRLVALASSALVKGCAFCCAILVIMRITERFEAGAQALLIEQLSFQQTEASSKLDPAQPLQ